MAKETKSKCKECYTLHEQKVELIFGKLGVLLSSHPVKSIVICLFINLSLGIGLLNLKVEKDTETLYTPQSSRSKDDRQLLRGLFPNSTKENFQPYHLTNLGLYGEIIILSKNGENIMSRIYLDEIKAIDSYIRNSITSGVDGETFTYGDVCYQKRDGCYVFGGVVLSRSFREQCIRKRVPFPIFGQTLMSPIFAQAVVQNNSLISTTGVKMRYHLRDNSPVLKSKSIQWEKEFVRKMTDYKTNLTYIAFSYSEALVAEIENDAFRDIHLALITFVLMVVYTSFATTSMNCNNIANRMNLGVVGVFITGLSALSALGFVCAIGIHYTSMVGVMPFLLLGIGIDDMFILMSGMADAPPLSQVNIEERVSFMMRKSAVAITITSLTDLVSFVIGASSVFRSIRNFCIFTGVAIFFCYLNQLFFLTPCFALNERRMEKRRHFCCCCIVSESKEALIEKQKTNSHIMCFGGNYPQNRLDVESPLEKYPKKVITVILRSAVGKILILIFSLAYLSFSIYGVMNLKHGVSLHTLVSEDSYFRRFSSWDEKFFTMEPIITIVVREQQDYSLPKTQDTIRSLILRMKRDPDIDDNFEINWLESYNNLSNLQTFSRKTFIAGLKHFLRTQNHFANDVVFDKSGSNILCSRFFLKANHLSTTTQRGEFMTRIRKMSNQSPIPILLYTPAFIYFEQYVQILGSTLQSVGISVGVMIIVAYIFMPSPFLVFLVGVCLTSILLGIFGFMYYMNLTLSFVTMVYLVMSVGFSVDFSLHICHAFVAVEGRDASDVMLKALDRSGGPICNSALSFLLGISLLWFSSSPTFVSFSKVMLLVIVFGLFHGAFILPMILSLSFPIFFVKQRDCATQDNDRQNHVSNTIPVISYYINSSYVPDDSGSTSVQYPSERGFYKYIEDGYVMYTPR